MALTVGPLAATRDVVAAPSATVRVLVFSKTAGFRHDSIAAGVDAIEQLGVANGFGVDTTEDAASFTTSQLANYDAVVFLSTTGDVLEPEQQAAFEDYIRNGGGFVGIHAAADAEYEWAWYGGLVGAYFLSHPEPQDATLLVEDHAHASTAHLGDTWQRFDEWYDFRDDPRNRVHVLLSVDPATLSGSQMTADHPIAWCHGYDGGNAWYTALGHTDESWAEPAFLQHVLGGIRTAAGVAAADCSAPDAPDPTTAAVSTEAPTTSAPGTPLDTSAPTTPLDTSAPETTTSTSSPSAPSPSAPLPAAPDVAASTVPGVTRSASPGDGSVTSWATVSVVAGTAALTAGSTILVRRRRRSR